MQVTEVGGPEASFRAGGLAPSSDHPFLPFKTGEGGAVSYHLISDSTAISHLLMTPLSNHNSSITRFTALPNSSRYISPGPEEKVIRSLSVPTPSIILRCSPSCLPRTTRPEQRRTGGERLGSAKLNSHRTTGDQEGGEEEETQLGGLAILFLDQHGVPGGLLGAAAAEISPPHSLNPRLRAAIYLPGLRRRGPRRPPRRRRPLA